MDEQQIQAYVTWVNSQLRKEPATRQIEDLRCDMQDGVALASLIRIVAGESLGGVYISPSSSAEKIANIERVLAFMTERRIRMHHTSAQDIVNGNLKSIMRLILALAAHFKPSSVKSSSAYRNSPSSTSVSGLAQNAVTALADARRDAQSAGVVRVRRPKSLVSTQHRLSGAGSDSSDHVFQGDQVRLVKHREHHLLDGASADSSSSRSSPRLSSRLTPDYGSTSSARTAADASVTSPEHERLLTALRTEHTQLENDMEITKKQLMALQNLLLSGQPPDGAESPENAELPAEGETAEEKLVVLKAKLQQSEETCRDLRDELSKVRQENMQLQGAKAGLQKRLNEQEESFLAMKAELLRVGFARQSLETEKSDLTQKISDKDRMLYDLRREMAAKDRQLDELMAAAQLHAQEKEAVTRTLRAQIQELHERLRRVGDTEQTLSARVQQQDAKMSRLEGRILQSAGNAHAQYEPPLRPGSSRSAHGAGQDELQLVRESIRTLRSNMPGNNTHQHTIDQLEESISFLMDKLNVTAEQSHRQNNKDGRRQYDSSGEVRQPMPTYQGFPLNQPAQWSDTRSPVAVTKVLYFTDRTVTPFMCNIPKRLGEIVLRDIKDLFDRKGNFRYHFKAMDPEFGTVKEEITADDDIIPGWEGKVVAWIEEDHG